MVVGCFRLPTATSNSFVLSKAIMRPLQHSEIAAWSFRFFSAYCLLIHQLQCLSDRTQATQFKGVASKSVRWVLFRPFLFAIYGSSLEDDVSALILSFVCRWLWLFVESSSVRLLSFSIKLFNHWCWVQPHVCHLICILNDDNTTLMELREGVRSKYCRHSGGKKRQPSSYRHTLSTECCHF